MEDLKESVENASDHKVKESKPDGSDTPENIAEELRKIYSLIQKRAYLVSSVMGDLTRPFNKRKGYVGLVVWIFHLCVHFSFDFYEAAYHGIFHPAWATAIGIYLIMFIVTSIFIVRHTIKWYVRLINKLTAVPMYYKTLTNLNIVFKVLPVAMLVTSLAGAGMQYGCYAADGALTLTFNSAGNYTNRNLTNKQTIPYSVEVVFNVVRFTSLMHIYYMMFLMLLFTIIIFYTIHHTQILFNSYMKAELSAQPPTVTFQEAVNKFSIRVNLLRSASQKTNVVLSTLIFVTSASFVINAYNFLFIRQRAIYVYFAIAPLLWNITPLVGAAFVTSSYKKFRYIVLQCWVLVPERFDKDWGRKDDIAYQENIRRRTNITNPHEKEPAIIKTKDIEKGDIKEKSDTKEGGMDTQKSNGAPAEINSNLFCEDISVERTNKGLLIIEKEENGRTKEEEIPKKSILSVFARKNTIDVTPPAKTTTVDNANKASSEDSTISGAEKAREEDETTESETKVNAQSKWKTFTKLKQNDQNDKPSDLTNTDVEQSKGPSLSAYRHVFQAVRVASTFANRSKKIKKFNYEKYIKFLELTLDVVGFSIGNVTITWKRVTTFLVVLFTMVGAFAQNALL